MSHEPNSVSILDRQRRFRLDKRQLEQALLVLLEALGLHGKELSVSLVGDRQMRTLNRQYRGMDTTTDVLSFAMMEGDGIQSPLLGDLVLSVPTLVRQCIQPFDDGRPFTGTPQRELALMAIHGTLHLLGFDHEKGPRKAALMVERETELFEMFWQHFPSISDRN